MPCNKNNHILLLLLLMKCLKQYICLNSFGPEIYQVIDSRIYALRTPKSVVLFYIKVTILNSWFQYYISSSVGI